MSYSALLLEEGIDSQYMAIITPKIKAETWILHSGSVYKTDFDYGYVASVFVDGSEVNEGSSPVLSANEFYYDFDDKVLYLRTSGGGDPSSSFTVVHFEIYTATFDKHWHRDPLDVNSVTVYWEPIIAKSPSLKTTASEVLFGYLPVQTSSITLNNFEHTFEEILYDASFNKASIKIYHLLDELDVDNIKLVYDGFMSDLSYNQETITIKCYDRRDIFNDEYRNTGANKSFYSTSDFANLDPNYIGNPIRKVFGIVDGVLPINIDYVQDNPTTSDNRTYGVCTDQALLSDLTATVGGGTHTTTRTYVSSAVGFTVGDSVWLDRAVGTDQYRIITLVDYGSNYIEHAAIPLAMVDGDTVKRSFVGNITIVQNSVAYDAMFGRDFTSEYALAGGVAGFSFTTSLEANLGMSGTLSTSDQIFVRVYGQPNNVTLGGPSFGSNDSYTGTLTNPIVILFKLLKDLGIPEGSINTASFTASVSTGNKPVGFSIPANLTDTFPTYKELIIQLAQTVLFKLFQDNDSKWKIKLLSQITGAADKSSEDDEILRDSISYEFSYNDLISDIVVQYAYKEKSNDLNKSNIWERETYSSDVALYLHGVKKQKSFDSLLLRSAEALELAKKLSDIFGDRSGVMNIRFKNRFFDTLLDTVIEIDRTKMPGFQYDGETLFSRKFSVITTEKSLRDVKIELDDQKGIQDNNSGEW